MTDHAPLIAAVITAMPLLMPFYFDYDLLLISVSAVCYAGIRMRERAAGVESLAIDRWITRGWVALYFWLMVNSSVARMTGVNGTVVLLSVVAGLLAYRAGGGARVREPHEIRSNLSASPFPFLTSPR